MRKNQIAAQMYTIRDYIQNANDFNTSCKKLKDIGFDAVQISGAGDICPKEMKKIIDDNGLICCATHESGDEIFNQTQKLVDKLNILDCKYTAYPYPSNANFDTLEGVYELANNLNKAGEIFYNNNQILTYHNHHIEFMKFNNELILDIIYDKTDPKFLQGEIDTYWVQAGGGNPVRWCKKLKDRLPLLHLKDYKIAYNKNKEITVSFAEIGNGNLNFKKIIKKAEESGCKWFIIEQDTCDICPFEALKISYNYLINNICE